MNWHNFYTYVLKCFFLVYNQKQNLKTPTDVTLFGRISSEVFVLLFVFDVYLHFIVVFHSFSGYFTMSSALHPGFSGPWRTLPGLSSTPTNSDCFFFFIYHERCGFEWTFFTHRHFLPYAPPQHFSHNLLWSRLPCISSLKSYLQELGFYFCLRFRRHF